MPTPRLSDESCIEVLNAIQETGGNQVKAAELIGINRETLRGRLREATRRGLAATAPPATTEPSEADLLGKLRKILKKERTPLESIAHRLGITRGRALDLCDVLRSNGMNVFVAGDSVSLESAPLPVTHDPDLHVFKSDDAGHYRFGIVTDNHLCSKYAREDVLNDLYDIFAREGVTRVYNAGNWIDGEAPFNKFDIHTYGMTDQLKYFAEHYPQRKGITTYYVAGDDHEGWYAKKFGADIGRMAEQTARDMGRTDLRYLGYMESYIRLEHAKTGNASQMLVVHPGGGSSYAISYAPQKFVESLQGGEKPAVVIFGHWHKMDVFNYRNVWIIQGGTTEDQTPFMRKQKIEAHVGGLIIDLYQDERGAITRCKNEQIRYFDRGYYNNAYAISGPTVNRNTVPRRR